MEMLNGYIAFYKGKQIEVRALTSYQAQIKAAAIFKAKKSYEITIRLTELQGKEVITIPND